RQQRKPVAYEVLNEQFLEIFLNLLAGNPTNALTATSKIYKEQLTSCMDFDGLHFVREQMKTVLCLAAAARPDGIPNSLFTPAGAVSIEEELAMLQKMILQCCRTHVGEEQPHERVIQALRYVAKHYAEEIS